MATSRRVGNYSTSAKAVVQNSDAIFSAAMDSKPDFTKISKEAMKGRGLERRAVTKAEAEVANAGIKAQAQVRQADIKGDELINRGKLAGQQYRKAGILAGLGGIATGFVMKSDRKAEAKERAARDARDAAQEERWRQLLDREPAKFEFNEKLPEAPGIDKPLPERPAGSIEPTQYLNSPSSNSSGSTVSTNISAQSSFDPTKRMSKAKIKALAESVGFNPEAAGIVVGIAGGESGFDPTNSTRRSGLYAKTGEDSVGLMQINWGYHKDSGWLQKLGITKREDLYDPVKNMKAAKHLYDGRKGGFGDWTVYNKGIYKDYL